MESNKNRINYLDIAKGISIILMIIGHIIPRNFISSIIYSFHMPLFIIVSGFFYKESNFSELIKKNFKSLLLPYLLCIIFWYIINSIINNNFNFIYLVKYILLANSDRKLSSVAGVGVLWFLPFLVVIRFLFNLIKKCSNKNEGKLFIIIILCTLLGVIFGYKGLYLPWSIDVAMACVSFYYVGYLIKKYNILNYLFENKFILPIIVLIYIITLLFGNIELSIRSYPFGFICFITAILGSIITFYISKFIDYFSKILSKILMWYGQNSIYILIFHCFENRLLNYNYFDSNILILIIVKLTIITLLTKFFLKLKKYSNITLLMNYKLKY